MCNIFYSFLADIECKIRTIEERDPRAAIIYLIDELCSDTSTEPGRWKQFIQALDTCGNFFKLFFFKSYHIIILCYLVISYF